MSDTIAAIATPGQPSAIGILRLSGPDTCAALDAVFRAKNGRPPRSSAPAPWCWASCWTRRGRSSTACCASVSLRPTAIPARTAPSSTATAAPSCWTRASAPVCRRLPPGGPGEFTKRAFLNGQLDLLQAESVADLIDAETAQQAHNAVCQLDGALSRTVARIYDGLMDMAARFYAVVDYPDEDIEDLQREQMLDTLRRAQNDLEALVAGFSRGRLLKLGVPTVLLGKPNAGKSSLLNALLGYDRAIVTDIAGTTRDTVEEKVTVGGVLLRLIDTAGIRDGGDAVETMGVERSRAAAKQASLALLVLDGSRELTAEDEAAIALANTVPHLIVAVNKSDLPRALDVGALADPLRQRAVRLRRHRRGTGHADRRHRGAVPGRARAPAARC